MNFNLQNRVAAVAASSAGLGFATALTLAREGCHVTICGRRPDKLTEAVERIRAETHVEVLAMPVDMGTADGPVNFVQRAFDHFGRLDIAVANAGDPPSGPFAAKTDQEWDYAVQLNLLSTIRMFRAALAHVRNSDQGRLIALTSISAKHPLGNRVLSNAVRVGVHGVVKTLSREVTHEGITVNVVCPGYTRTELLAEMAEHEAERTGMTVDGIYANWAAAIPMERLGHPLELGAAVAFLCSQQAAFISGISLPVDGGYMAALP